MEDMGEIMQDSKLENRGPRLPCRINSHLVVLSHNRLDA
jgi:hypothetical protein